MNRRLDRALGIVLGVSLIGLFAIAVSFIVLFFVAAFTAGYRQLAAGFDASAQEAGR